MADARVHFEVFVRKKPGSGWTLEMASEDRGAAVGCARDLFEAKQVIAAKVTKETLDEASRQFQTVTILTLGAPDAAKKPKVREDLEPLCVTPQDLYTLHARERIGRLLEEWLERKHATAFELLHRPDLVEQLEASGTELQHAIQKIAVPEAQARGCTVHELIRTFHTLVERAIERLMKDSRRGVLPDIDKEGFAAAAERVSRDPDRAYLLGAGVAATLVKARTWSDKVDLLLDLADAAPIVGPPRGVALTTIEQPLAEILGAKAGMEHVLGKGLDLGGELAAMTRLAAGKPVDMLMRVEPSVAKVMPPLSGPATRLSKWLDGDDFIEVRTALGKRILRELMGPRRLRPDDAAGEIDLLRGLAMALTAAAGKLLPLEEVQAAFSARSRMLVTGDFVEAYLGKGRTAHQECEALIWLTENVIGAANKRNAGRWVLAIVSALRFEKEFRAGDESAAVRLQKLAGLARAIARCGLAAEDVAPVQAKLGEIGGVIEAEAKLTASLGKSPAPAIQRLAALLRLASGETAPLGPAADRARAEALKLVRRDETRTELSRSPEQMATVRDLIQQAGLAA